MKKIVNTADAPKAIGPYSQAIIEPRLGLVFTSGQIAIDPKTGVLVGSDIKEQADQVFRNLQAILNTAGCGFEGVIKSTLYLKNIEDFGVVNEVYAEHFIKDSPARSTVEVSRLPKDALVEIEMIACI
jgi:2-iminobutanoate/2-iminopropanoate deaminase